MAKSYDEYEVDQLAKAKKQQQDYEQTARAQAGARAGEIQSLYDGLIADADRQYRQRAGDTAASYRGLYDANAVNELVARRNAQAAMADAGLRQSGLNASQQTAISLMRGNADAAVTRQKQDAVNSIMAALDELRSQYNAKAAAQKQDVYAALEDSVAKNWQTLDAQARQTAAALYQADVENERAAAEAQQKYKQWLYEQQLAATKQAQDYDVAMRKQGYTPVDDGEGGITYRKFDDAAYLPMERNTVYGAKFGDRYYNGQAISKTTDILSKDDIISRVSKLIERGLDMESAKTLVNVTMNKFGYTPSETADVLLKIGYHA
ncbi:MAG: hypothetical protein IJU16_06450 [Clostridia bacterium]|nr:hypothetical protein [Clostridia bacterium]